MDESGGRDAFDEDFEKDEFEEQLPLTEWMAVYKNIDTQSDDLTQRDIDDGKDDSETAKVVSNSLCLCVCFCLWLCL